MKIIDVHCHLESDHFTGNLDSVIGDAVNAGVVKLITSSIGPDQWEKSESIAREYQVVEFALGVHPWYIQENYLASLKCLGNARQKGAVAIGEIGLDRKTRATDFALQQRFFEEQLATARDIGLPVIVHCRGAFNELIQSVKRIGMPKQGGIIHSFSGSVELAHQLIPLGFSFSLGGILTYRNSGKRTTLMNHIYPDHFLLETDSPDIPPVPFNGETNYPHYITYNLQAAAELLNETVESVAAATTRNAVSIFNLELEYQGGKAC